MHPKILRRDPPQNDRKAGPQNDQNGGLGMTRKGSPLENKTAA